MTKFIVVTHMGKGMFLVGQRHNCICTNVSHGLTVIAEFLVLLLLSVWFQF